MFNKLIICKTYAYLHLHLNSILFMTWNMPFIGFSYNVSKVFIPDLPLCRISNTLQLLKNV